MKVLSGAQDIADELGTFFESTFISESPGDVPTLQRQIDVLMPDLEFTSNMVQDIIKHLNISKSYGPDHIHPKLLKCLSNIPSFVTSLVKLFQKCYDTSSLPSIWKKAEVTAIHKKGDKAQPCNYRPISLTCILAKTF